MSIEFPYAEPWHPGMLQDRTLGDYIDRLYREGKLPRRKPREDDVEDAEPDEPEAETREAA